MTAALAHSFANDAHSGLNPTLVAGVARVHSTTAIASRRGA